MLKLVKKARLSAEGDLSMSWLEPYMTSRSYKKNDRLFRKGDKAGEMFIVVTGKFLVTELGLEIPPGRLFGELGFLSPNNHRTQSVECIESGSVLTITYDKLLELYFQNPEFGYYFLRLTSERLLQNMARLETIIEQNKEVITENQAAQAAATSPPVSSRPEASPFPTLPRKRGRIRGARRAGCIHKCTAGTAGSRVSRSGRSPGTTTARSCGRIARRMRSTSSTGWKVSFTSTDFTPELRRARSAAVRSIEVTTMTGISRHVASLCRIAAS